MPTVLNSKNALRGTDRAGSITTQFTPEAMVDECETPREMAGHAPSRDYGVAAAQEALVEK